MEEDWDNLLILDACRYDMFAELCPLDGRLESRTSRGSSTPEFLRTNFRGRKFPDTVYVNGNPQGLIHLDEDVFCETIHVWKDGWDEELETIHPKTMVEFTLRAADEWPNKRLLVHFMQPHYPFIGDTGRKIEQGGITGARDELVNTEGDGFANVWRQLRQGNIDRDTFVRAYAENLVLVFPHIDDLLAQLDGKTVVTSDHGNVIGERLGFLPIPLYGHPTGIHIESLVKVPWFVIEGERRTITAADEGSASAVTDEETAQERLKHLGYVE